MRGERCSVADRRGRVHDCLKQNDSKTSRPTEVWVIRTQCGSKSEHFRGASLLGQSCQGSSLVSRLTLRGALGRKRREGVNKLRSVQRNGSPLLDDGSPIRGSRLPCNEPTRAQKRTSTEGDVVERSHACLEIHQVVRNTANRRAKRLQSLKNQRGTEYSQWCEHAEGHASVERGVTLPCDVSATRRRVEPTWQRAMRAARVRA